MSDLLSLFDFSDLPEPLLWLPDEFSSLLPSDEDGSPPLSGLLTGNRSIISLMSRLRLAPFNCCSAISSEEPTCARAADEP